MSRDLSDIREVIMRMSGGTAISPRAESAQGERRGQHCLCLRNSKKADAVETKERETRRGGGNRQVSIPLGPFWIWSQKVTVKTLDSILNGIGGQCFQPKHPRAWCCHY